MEVILAEREQSLKDQWFSGGEASDTDRRVHHKVSEWVEDFFESSAEDIIEALKRKK
jgi:hypothetical protein